ncbi:MAG: 6-phosphogluconolactonase [Chromatiales bacterium]|nr:6-phosphogluconolactonase [Gammaproteobacteria bacterium]MCP5352807.1 6-phosphogluconolactonase [Chromatiales bacterium]
MIDWHIHDTPDEVADAVLAELLAKAGAAIRARGRFVIALSGGGTPQAVYDRLAADQTIDLSKWVLLYADDRCVPVGNTLRNDVAVVRAGLANRAAAHLSMPTELGPDGGARLYARMIAPFLPLDMAYLGMGPDGHTASLFPGHDLDPDAVVVGVRESPKPPPERVSLGLSTLLAARERVVQVTGAGKAEAVSRWRAGEPLPIARVCSPGAAVFMDRDAAGDAGAGG